MSPPIIETLKTLKILKHTAVAALIIAALVFLAACVTPENKPETIGRGATWIPVPKLLDKMKDECWNVNPFLLSPQKASQCCIDIMESAGAPPEAVAFSRAMLQKRGDTFCYMSSFKKVSIVDIAELACPFRDEETSDMVLLNGQPAIVEINDMNNLSKINLLSEPDYLKMLGRHTEALLWPYTGGLVEVKKLPQGAERYVFDFRLLNGCEACPLAGVMTVGYDFNAAGSFTGVKLIKLVTAE
ncbi:MAG: hypothetical protein HQK96_12150 [Nitrospirae bacterium]|nr:hypothetical protein [Nitrospirota bacterium]